MKRFAISLLLLLSTSLTAAPLTIDWPDLQPEDERNATVDVAPVHDGNMTQQNTEVRIIKDYDGKTVRIPGFVVPLEGDENKITEFLLVPYFGACIHVPPPPPNQIIYVKFPQGAPVDQLWDAIWVTGKLEAKTINNELAVIGYSLEADSFEVYQE